MKNNLISSAITLWTLGSNGSAFISWIRSLSFSIFSFRCLLKTSTNFSERHLHVYIYIYSKVNQLSLDMSLIHFFKVSHNQVKLYKWTHLFDENQPLFPLSRASARGGFLSFSNDNSCGLLSSICLMTSGSSGASGRWPPPDALLGPWAPWVWGWPGIFMLPKSIKGIAEMVKQLSK